MLPFGNISERIFTHTASHYACKHTTILAVWQGRKCRLRTAEPHPPFSFPRKKTGGVTVQKKGTYIASEQLEELQCLPIALPIARRSRVGLCYTTWLAPTIRCRSARLVGVQPNFRLLEHSSMRRAPAMPLFRTQSAAR